MLKRNRKKQISAKDPPLEDYYKSTYIIEDGYSLDQKLFKKIISKHYESKPIHGVMAFPSAERPESKNQRFTFRDKPNMIIIDSRSSVPDKYKFRDYSMSDSVNPYINFDYMADSYDVIYIKATKEIESWLGYTKDTIYLCNLNHIQELK
jgi:hypothetical protein